MGTRAAIRTIFVKFDVCSICCRICWLILGMEIDVVEEEECDETEATEQELKRQPSIWEKKRLVCVCT